MKKIMNGEGLKIIDYKLYINGDVIRLDTNIPGIDNSKLIILMPDMKGEWSLYTEQEKYHRKQSRLQRRTERKRQRAECRAQKKYRFLWFRF